MVTQYADRYEDEYAKAWQVADRLIALLKSDGRFKIQKVPNGTSRFFLTAAGTEPRVLAERVMKRGVILPQTGTGALPMQVNPTILRTTPEALAQTFTDALKG